MRSVKKPKPQKSPKPKEYYENKGKARAKFLHGAYKTGSRVFVFTSATTDSTVNQAMLSTLHTYCAHNKAHLGIIGLKYKNPDKTYTKNYVPSWASELEDYLISGRICLGNIVILPDLKITPTSSKPLSAKEPIEGTNWTVFGHPQIAMKTVPTYPGGTPKRMYTTGSCTRPVYGQKDVSARAEFHHVTGAIVVEVTKDFTFVRQLLLDSSGGFYDLDTYYRGSIVTTGHRALGLNCGDEHARIVDRSAVDATFGPNGLASLVKPQYIFRHDVLDAFAISHHHVGRTALEYSKWDKGEDNILLEMIESLDYLIETTPEGSTSVIVRSNHHDHVDQWLDRADSRKDFTNAVFIDTMRILQRRDIREGGDGHIYRIYGEAYLRNLIKFKFLGYDSPFFLKGIDMANHGHVGVNGSKGSISGFAKVVSKTYIAHGHTAGIEKGCYQIAKKSTKAEYEKGYSSHTLTDGLVYKNGKRTLIDYHNGQFRGTDQRKVNGKKTRKKS